MQETALIVGAGAGLSASLARQLAAADRRVVLAARNTTKLESLCKEIGASAFACDATRPEQVEDLFDRVQSRVGTPSVVIYNAGMQVFAPLVEQDPGKVAESIAVNAFGGFLVGRHAARLMLQAGGGAIAFTGAAASVRGYPSSAPFAMGKFALRGLAQSMARELAPHNVHVIHVVIDGVIRSPHTRQFDADAGETRLDPDAIARSYLHLIDQPRSAWSWEIELRPWQERF